MGNIHPIHEQTPEQPSTWDIFYQLYPRHEARKDALKAWGRLTEAQKVAAAIAIADWRQVWKAQGRDIHLIPLPATWLNGERWEDEVPKGVINHKPGISPEYRAANAVTGDAHPIPRAAAIPAHVLAMFQKLKEGK